MPDGASHRGVGELDADRRVTEQQTAPAHVAASDEVEWELQPLAKDRDPANA